MLDITQGIAEEIMAIEKRRWRLMDDSSQNWNDLVSYASGFLKHVEQMEIEAMERVKKDFSVKK